MKRKIRFPYIICTGNVPYTVREFEIKEKCIMMLNPRDEYIFQKGFEEGRKEAEKALMDELIKEIEEELRQEIMQEMRDKKS